MKPGIIHPVPLLSIVLLIVFAVLSGCAITDQRLDFSYVPIDTTLSRQNATVSVWRDDVSTFIRNNRGEWIVGSLNNVHGVHEADLVSDNNQGDWLMEALVLELKRSGFSVTINPPLPAATGIGIRLNNIKAFMNVNTGILSSDISQELKFSADFFGNGSKIKSFTVSSRSGQTVPLRASSNETRTILTQTFQDALHQVLSELRFQLEKR